MRYCVGNLTEKQVAVLRRVFEDGVGLYLNTLAELTDQTVQQPEDVEMILSQLRNPVEQDERMGQVWASLIFADEEDESDGE